jgi:hypothetical protein
MSSQSSQVLLPRLRQAVVAAWDLHAVAATFRNELELCEGFHDPGVGEFGLHNEVLPIGNTFFEVVSPRERTTPTAAGRFLQRTEDRGGYMAIFQVVDAEQARARIRDLGLRIVWSGELHGIIGTHIHPADIGGAIVSLDATSDAIGVDGWPWAGPDWRSQASTAVASSICGLEIAAKDPHAMALRWGGVLGLNVPENGSERVRVDLSDGGYLSFRKCADDGEPEGIVSMFLAASNAARIGTSFTVAGCQMTFVAPPAD